MYGGGFVTNNFPSKLKGLRIDKKLSQQAVADKLDVSRATLVGLSQV